MEDNNVVNIDDYKVPDEQEVVVVPQGDGETAKIAIIAVLSAISGAATLFAAGKIFTSIKAAMAGKKHLDDVRSDVQEELKEFTNLQDEEN